MPQRQVRSAAPSKMQEGQLSLGNTLEGSLAPNENQQGKIFFEKTLAASSLPPRSQLVIPALFVKEHGAKFGRSVTLRNVENDRKWTVEVDVVFPQKRLQVVLHYGCWKAFAIANDLAIGDRLAFVLVAQSSFDVLILRRGGNSSLPVRKPKIGSQDPISTRKDTNPETDLRRGPPTNGCEGSELARTGALRPKETAEQTSVGTGLPEVVATQTYDADRVAPEAPDSSESPAGMNFHGLEQMTRQDDCMDCQVEKMTQLGMLDSRRGDFHRVFSTALHTVLNG